MNVSPCSQVPIDKRRTSNLLYSKLLQAIGAEAWKISKGFAYAAGETKDSPQTLIQKYDEYFLSETRDFIEKLKFSRCVQQQHEAFEEYLSELRLLASTCNFCSPICSDNCIMDHILDGHKSFLSLSLSGGFTPCRHLRPSSR